MDKNRSELASRGDAVHSAHTCVFIDGALTYRLDFTRTAERRRRLQAPFDLQLDWREMLKFSTDKSDCHQVEGTIFFNIAGEYFFHAIFTLKTLMC